MSELNEEQSISPEVSGDAPLLSELVDQPLSRRIFFRKAAVASVAAAAATAAACNPRGSEETAVEPPTTFNSSSRSDSTLDLSQTSTAETAGAVDLASIPLTRYDPTLPPVSTERTLRLNWRANEVPVRISADKVMAAWTFEGDVPGPIVHVRVGDTVEFTLTNDGAVPHSMDFHAAQIDPRVAFKSVSQGESVSFTFRARYPGAYMYHCGTGPVLMHIGAGMYGAIIVDPVEPLPPAKEFVLVQSEYYLGGGDDGISTVDYNRMLATAPDFVVFNGRPDQYIREPVRVSVGDRVRFYVVAAGPSHPCNFHVVGEQFDTVWIGAPPSGELRGVQTFAVPPGGGMIFDFIADVPGEFPFVNHGFGHGQRGAVGFLVVE